MLLFNIFLIYFAIQIILLVLPYKRAIKLNMDTTLFTYLKHIEKKNNQLTNKCCIIFFHANKI